MTFNRTALRALAVGALILWGGVAQATPRMSLTAGTPCSGCHYSPNGGGGRTELGWSPRFPELRDIVDSAWRWHRAHPDGYPE